MLTIKRPASALSPLWVSFQKILLVFALGTACSHAKDNENYRHEPISPIPLEVNVDQDKAKLGERLFFDRRLSRNNKLSCASCHILDDGGDDNVAMGESISAEKHVINTPSIFNARYNFRQNWDGSTRSLSDQVNFVMSNRHEFDNTWDEVIKRLSLDTSLKDEFSNVFTNGITKNNIIDAIVEFENSLITPNSRFDRYLRNETNILSNQEIEGYLAFKDLGCISCHQGINIGGNLYQKFGVFYNYIAERGKITTQDYGRKNITGRQMDAFVFKVPSLRNIAVTAPYLHDGSADTIEEVIAIMGKTQLGRSLTEKEITIIKAFLNTLTGEYNNKALDEKS